MNIREAWERDGISEEGKMGKVFFASIARDRAGTRGGARDATSDLGHAPRRSSRLPCASARFARGALRAPVAGRFAARPFVDISYAA